MRLPLRSTALLGGLLLATGMATAAEAKDIEVRLHDNPFHILPEEATASPGFVVTFHVRNDGSVPHDFRVCDLESEGGCASPLGIIPPLPPGGEANLTVRVGDVGAYRYYCTIPGHAEGGMEGVLNVSGSGAGIPAVPLAALALGLLAAAWGRRR